MEIFSPFLHLVLKDFVWAGCALEKQQKPEKQIKTIPKAFSLKCFYLFFWFFSVFLTKRPPCVTQLPAQIS